MEKNLTPEQIEMEMARKVLENTRKRRATKKDETPKETPKQIIPSNEGMKATNETAETIEEKETQIRKTFYGTAGITWQILPNLLDFNGEWTNKETGEKHQFPINQHPEALELKNKLPKQLKETYLLPYQPNGEIKLLKVKLLGHSEYNYLLVLIPNKDLDIKVWKGIRQTYSDGTAKQQGRDTREWEYESTEIITIKKNQILPLGMTTNPGKAIRYGTTWGFITKTYFNIKEYKNQGGYTITNSNFQTYDELPDGTWTVNNRNREGYTHTTTLHEIFQKEETINSMRYIG